MSGLAEILLEEGFTVTGSDSHETGLTDHLTDRGARVYYGQRAANIEKEPGIDVVVYTAAIHEDNPEFMAVKEKDVYKRQGVMRFGYAAPAFPVSGNRGGRQ